ncbi:MAG: response regulator, partial [Dehalococcoidia bacterium]
RTFPDCTIKVARATAIEVVKSWQSLCSWLASTGAYGVGGAEEMTRILLVDDQVFFTELLRNTLSGEPGLEVVGVAHDGETAVQMARDTSPDAVVMDIELPGELDGIEAGLQIKRERPETGIVVLSMYDDRRYVTSLPLYESPGWSYLLKQTLPDLGTLVRAIQGSTTGMTVLDPAVITNLRPKEGSVVMGLTPRLQEVLQLIAQGFSNAAIAEQLTLTEKSVETYISTIYQQLQISGEQDIHARVRATLLYLEESQSIS